MRAFTFGHVGQLDAVASRELTGLAPATPVVVGIDDRALVDIDDTVVDLHGYGKQVRPVRRLRVRGLRAIAATVTTKTSAPVMVATRLRKGRANSSRGVARIATDAFATVMRVRAKDATGMVLVRSGTADYGRPTILAALKAGATISVTVCQHDTIRTAIEQVDVDAWTTIYYPGPPGTGRCVAEWSGQRDRG